MLHKLSLQNMILDYKDHMDKSKSKEGLDSTNTSPQNNNAGTVAAVGAGTFTVLLVAMIVLYVYAVMILVKNWNKLGDVEKIIGLLGVLPVVPVGPIITIIVVKLGVAKSKK